MAKPVRRATLTAQIEDALREDIISGTFAPGQRLTTAELALRYQVSATPLREALQRLAARKLVEIDPGLGATVPPISRAHLRDTYRVREMLEVAAVARSIERADARWEFRVRELFGEFQMAVALSQGGGDDGLLSWSPAHRAFHEGLMANCESPWLKSLLHVINDHSERYRMLSARTGVRDPIGEHAAIFEAALARDVDAATEALRQHLERTVEVLECSLPVIDADDTLAQGSDGQARRRRAVGAAAGSVTPRLSA